MFTRLYISNLRLFTEIELDNLAKFNLFVGRNNVGKTSLLEGVFLMVAPSHAGLSWRINNFRGIEEADEVSWAGIFNNTNVQVPIRMEADLHLKGRLERRVLTISADHIMSLDDEVADKATGASSPLNSEASTTSHLPINGLRHHYVVTGDDGEEKEINTLVTGTGREIGATMQKGYQEPISAVFYSPRTLHSGMNARLSRLKIDKKTPVVLKVLKKIDPSIIGIEMAADTVYCDIGVDRLIPVHLMGDGIIKALSLLVALYECRDGVIVIDEIENGLHFSALSTVWQVVVEAARDWNVQVFVTTHSLESVRAFYGIMSSELPIRSGEFRVTRLERRDSRIAAIDFNRETLATALEHDWEIR